VLGKRTLGPDCSPPSCHHDGGIGYNFFVQQPRQIAGRKEDTVKGPKTRGVCNEKLSVQGPASANARVTCCKRKAILLEHAATLSLFFIWRRGLRFRPSPTTTHEPANRANSLATTLSPLFNV
jgi:hypothetical protein